MTTLRILPLAILLAGLALPAGASTLRVPSERATIREAVTVAAPGDTVLVAPGRYTELIEMKDAIVLRAEAGPDSTVLVSPGLGQGPLDERLLVCPAGVGLSTVIEGFTFDAAGLGGAAIVCDDARPTIRGNVIRGFGWAVKLENGSDALVDGNVIEDSRTFGILVFASSPRIVRNRLVDNQPHAITIAGKESHPVIGGSREAANVILRSDRAIRNDSRNDIDATWNDWGWEVMAEMQAKGWPADIVTLLDGNDVEDTRKGKGRIDYRHWLTPEATAGAAEPDRRVWIVVGLAGLLALGFVVVARR